MGEKSRRAYDRLSAADSSFVVFDDGSGSLNIGAIACFADGPMLDENGLLDLERIADHIETRLDTLPRYRQRLGYSPIQGHPIWVDDDHFDVSRHVRCYALRGPGSQRQLKELAGQIMSGPLDPARPLWELNFVEGLEGGGFGLVARVHHSMVDGVAGVGVLTALLSPLPEELPVSRKAWVPRPAPNLVDFVADGVEAGFGAARDLLGTLTNAIRHPMEAAEAVVEIAEAGALTLRQGLHVPPETPFNGPIGRQRRLDWFEFDLGAIKDLRKRLDGTVNDVVLSIVAGAVRKYLRQSGVPVKGMNLRTIVPVDTRSVNESDYEGNRVSNWFVDLPIYDADPIRRYVKINEQTKRYKEQRAEQGVDRFLRFADWAGSSRLPALAVSFANMLTPYNMVVTNVHGPPVPLYLLGSRMTGLHPVVPLLDKQGFAIAVMSYVDRVSFCVLADWDLVPDVALFAEAIAEAEAELRTAAERPERKRRRSAPPKRTRKAS